jgi:hypothetical protein
MKTFTQFNAEINENCTTADVNPGNSLDVGVTNHLTPVENILTNVRNLFGVTGVVFAKAEDGFSIKMNSSRFWNKEETQKILYEPIYQNQSIYSYINQQGLSSVKIINIGNGCVVYMGPNDIKAAMPGLEPDTECCVCKEMQDYNIDEAELLVCESGDDGDEEIEKLTLKQLKEIINAKDKVRAAKQFGILVSQQVSLPSDYYFAGVKSKDGDESIALRWKYIKRRPHGKSTEVTRSLINIFGTGDDAVWVGDFDKKTSFKLPDEVEKLINSILELLGAEKTSDSCVYKIAKDDEDKSKDDDKDKDKDDDEDDNSRGDNDDDSDDNKSDDNDGDDKKKDDDTSLL